MRSQQRSARGQSSGTHCAQRDVSPHLVFLAPVVLAWLPGLHSVHQMHPTTRLDTRLMDAPSRRRAVGLGERGRRRSVDAQVHSALMQRGDLVSRNEALACPATDHDSVKDVFRWGRDHVVNRSNQVALRSENGHILFQYLVRNRKALVHAPHTSVRPGFGVPLMKNPFEFCAALDAPAAHALAATPVSAPAGSALGLRADHHAERQHSVGGAGVPGVFEPE